MNGYTNRKWKKFLAESRTPTKPTKVSEDSKKFEWVIVAKLLEMAHGETEDLGSVVGVEVSPEDLLALKQAQTEWVHIKGKSGQFGEQASQVASKMISSGFFTDEEVKSAKTASMAGLKKVVLVPGGRAGEVKADIVLGNKGVSIKMTGAVQLASSELPSTAAALELVFREWGKDNFERALLEAQRNSKPSFRTIMQATLIPKLREIVAQLKHFGADWEGDDQQKMVKAKRYIQQNKVENIPSQEEINSETDPKKKQKMQKQLDKLLSLVLKDEVRQVTDDSYEIVTESYEEAVVEIKDGVFKELARILTIEPTLHRLIVDELASGRRQLRKHSSSVALYLASPEYTLSLNPSDAEAYEKTIDYLQKLVPIGALRIAAKGRGAYSAITLRPDVTPKALKAAKHLLELGKEANNLQEGFISDGFRRYYDKFVNSSKAVIKRLSSIFDKDLIDVEKTAKAILRSPAKYLDIETHR